MATAKQIKQDLKKHAQGQMAEWRKYPADDMLRYIAWGAVQAARWVDAISKEEYETLMDELLGKATESAHA